MAWYFFAILAATLWAFSNIIDRVTYTKFIKNPMTPMLVLGIIQLLTVAIIWFTKGIEPFSLLGVMLAIIGGLTYSSMCVCYIFAVRNEEISKVIPLFGFAPVFVTLLAALTLGEVFSVLTYVGIALVITGAVTLSVQRLEGFKFNIAFWLMIGAAASIAITEVVSKYLLGFYDYWSVFAYTRAASALSLLVIAWQQRDELISMVRLRRGKILGLMTTAELLNVMGILSIIIASSKGFVTLVNSLTQIQPFIVLLLALLLGKAVPQILKEEGGAKVFVRKLGSIIVIFIGVVLVLSFNK